MSTEAIIIIAAILAGIIFLAWKLKNDPAALTKLETSVKDHVSTVEDGLHARLNQIESKIPAVSSPPAQTIDHAAIIQAAASVVAAAVQPKPADAPPAAAAPAPAATAPAAAPAAPAPAAPVAVPVPTRVYFDASKYAPDKVLAAFQKLVAESGITTAIFNPLGVQLDVAGRPMGSTDAAPVPFDFGKSMPLYVGFVTPDDPAHVYDFNVPADGNYWMDAGWGAQQGDLLMDLSQAGASLAAGNSGIDEGGPVAMKAGSARFTVKCNADSVAVKQRVATGEQAARGYYIFRAS